MKVDRSFVSEVGLTRGDTALVHGLVSLAHRVGRIVVAEGVETLDQLAALLDSGCDHAQGYLFSRPLAPDLAHRLAVDPTTFDGDVDDLIEQAS